MNCVAGNLQRTSALYIHTQWIEWWRKRRTESVFIVYCFNLFLSLWREITLGGDHTNAVTIVNEAVICRNCRVIYCITCKRRDADSSTTARLSQSSGPACTSIGSVWKGRMGKPGRTWKKPSAPTTTGPKRLLWSFIQNFEVPQYIWAHFNSILNLVYETIQQYCTIRQICFVKK